MVSMGSEDAFYIRIYMFMLMLPQHVGFRAQGSWQIRYEKKNQLAVHSSFSAGWKTDKVGQRRRHCQTWLPDRDVSGQLYNVWLFDHGRVFQEHNRPHLGQTRARCSNAHSPWTTS